jgi:hypothetical protein
MTKKLHLRREALGELTPIELTAVRGGTTPFATDGHHCFGSTLCVGVQSNMDVCYLTSNQCFPESIVGC